MAVMGYRTRDGLANYGFSIEFNSNEGWQVYVMFQPFPQGGDADTKLPYQSHDHNGRRYVDWPSKMTSLGEAKIVAELWAELIHSYWQTRRPAG